MKKKILIGISSAILICGTSGATVALNSKHIAQEHATIKVISPSASGEPTVEPLPDEKPNINPISDTTDDINTPPPAKKNVTDPTASSTSNTTPVDSPQSSLVPDANNQIKIQVVPPPMP